MTEVSIDKELFRFWVKEKWAAEGWDISLIDMDLAVVYEESKMDWQLGWDQGNELDCCDSCIF